MIKPDSNKCVLQDGRCKAISAVLNNYLDIINALEKLTMASGNSTELIAKASHIRILY